MAGASGSACGVRSRTHASATCRTHARTVLEPHAARSRCPRFAGRRMTSLRAQRLDVIALGNICLDIVLPMESLPPADMEERRRMLEELTANPPAQDSWEVGGNCNFMIAAARLGLSVGSVGHVGNDRYGQFVDTVLQVCADTAVHGNISIICMSSCAWWRHADGQSRCAVCTHGHSRFACRTWHTGEKTD